MNWKKILGHTILNGVGTGLAMIPAGVPITTKTVALPVAASVLTGLMSLFTQHPSEDRK